MIGREGPGPERPGPDYPPEWDREPDEEEYERLAVLGGYGLPATRAQAAEREGREEFHPCSRCLTPSACASRCCPDDDARQPPICPLCRRIPAPGEQHRQVYAVGDTGEDADEVCVGPDRRQLDYAPIVPDPWQSQGSVPPPPF